MAKRGWPTDKKNEEKVQKFVTALQNWLGRDSACAVSWLPRRTMYDWLEGEEFRTKVEDAEEYRISVVEKAKHDLIKDKHWEAIKHELKSKKYEVYGDKKKVEMKVDGKIDFTKMKPDQLYDFIEKGWQL